MLLMETLAALPLTARQRNMKDIKKPPKYSLKFIGKLRRQFNLPKEYTRQDFNKYYNAYSIVYWAEHP